MTNTHRLDQELVRRGLVATRSQAESYIRMGKVLVNGKVATKTGIPVREDTLLEVAIAQQYVSRAALKLASVAEAFDLHFQDKIVLDVGSSTGGFTDFALKHGAAKVIAVDVGTDQLHPSLHGHPLIELHEQTDIRNMQELSDTPDVVVIDVSFISMREVLPQVLHLSGKKTAIVAMLKPQFEAGREQVNKGIIKNERVRRDILKGFEQWVGERCVIQRKSDSQVAGSKGNVERFYLLKKL